MLDSTALYPGVRETLEDSSDCKLAVLTNKPVISVAPCWMVLGSTGISRPCTAGTASIRRSRIPSASIQILSDTKGHREKTWMIGDSAVDVLTGRNAGVMTCGVTYGYATETFKDAQPDFLIDRVPRPGAIDQVSPSPTGRGWREAPGEGQICIVTPHPTLSPEERDFLMLSMPSPAVRPLALPRD